MGAIVRPPLSNLQEVGCFDLVILCKDGRLPAHQWLFGRHSRLLRRLFLERGSLTSVELVVPRIPGLAPRLREAREAAQLVTLALPDYSLRTVKALHDLLYTGECKDPGDIGPEGHLNILGLYRWVQQTQAHTDPRDLGLEGTHGGLPKIMELEQIEHKVSPITTVRKPENGSTIRRTENANVCLNNDSTVKCASTSVLSKTEREKQSNGLKLLETLKQDKDSEDEAKKKVVNSEKLHFLILKTKNQEDCKVKLDVSKTKQLAEKSKTSHEKYTKVQRSNQFLEKCKTVKQDGKVSDSRRTNDSINHCKVELDVSKNKHLADEKDSKVQRSNQFAEKGKTVKKDGGARQTVKKDALQNEPVKKDTLQNDFINLSRRMVNLDKYKEIWRHHIANSSFFATKQDEYPLALFHTV